MNLLAIFTSFLNRFPGMAAVLYAGAVVALLFTAFTTAQGVRARQDEVADTAATLSQLEGRTAPQQRRSLPQPAGTDAAMTGSPLLEGGTLTIAGASLLQRVAASITKAGGSIVYTQVDLEGPQAKDGFIGVTVNCEIAQPALQDTLYDLEAGMPFLFIDQLVAQGPAVPGQTPEGKLRILISVTGQWQPPR